MGAVADFPSGLHIAVMSATLLSTAAVWLFYGWRLYWLFITLVTGSAAAIVGWFFVAPHFDEGLRYLPPLLLGIAGGAIAVPLRRFVAFAATGALGAVVAVCVAGGFCGMPVDAITSQFVAVAAAGFLVAGVPAAILSKSLNIVTTSGYGALLAIAAVAIFAFVSKEEPPNISAGTLVGLLAAWVALTTVGVIFQSRAVVIHKAQTAS